MKQGLEALTQKQPPISEMTLLDWYAGMALMGCSMKDAEKTAIACLDRAQAMIDNRGKYLNGVKNEL